jgi:hypothetical protein
MKHFVLLFFFFTLSLQAQFQVNGIVKDASTKKALPFATINTNEGTNTVSDVDGKFSITSQKEITALEISYVGYLKNTIPTQNNKSFYSVFLIQKTDELHEVIVSNENPAIGIIEKTIANKKKNNPLERLSSFEFKSYNKLIVTANPDSINGSIDSVFTTTPF